MGVVRRSDVRREIRKRFGTFENARRELGLKSVSLIEARVARDMQLAGKTLTRDLVSKLEKKAKLKAARARGEAGIKSGRGLITSTLATTQPTTTGGRVTITSKGLVTERDSQNNLVQRFRISKFTAVKLNRAADKSIKTFNSNLRLAEKNAYETRISQVERMLKSKVITTKGKEELREELRKLKTPQIFLDLEVQRKRLRDFSMALVEARKVQAKNILSKSKPISEVRAFTKPGLKKVIEARVNNASSKVINRLREVYNKRSIEVTNKTISRLLLGSQLKRLVNVLLPTDFKAEFTGAAQIKFVNEVVKQVINDLIDKPIQNVALLGAGFLTGKAVKVGGSIIKFVAKKSPRIAKVISKGGKIGAGTILLSYIGGVIFQGKQEFDTTGKISKTTANAIRELLLFERGFKLAGLKQALSPAKKRQLKDLLKTEKLLKKQLKTRIKSVSKKEKITLKDLVGQTRKEFNKLVIKNNPVLQGLKRELVSLINTGLIGSKTLTKAQRVTKGKELFIRDLVKDSSKQIKKRGFIDSDLARKVRFIFATNEFFGFSKSQLNRLNKFFRFRSAKTKRFKKGSMQPLEPAKPFDTGSDSISLSRGGDSSPFDLGKSIDLGRFNPFLRAKKTPTILFEVEYAGKSIGVGVRESKGSLQYVKVIGDGRTKQIQVIKTIKKKPFRVTKNFKTRLKTINKILSVHKQSKISKVGVISVNQMLGLALSQALITNVASISKVALKIKSLVKSKVGIKAATKVLSVQSVKSLVKVIPKVKVITRTRLVKVSKIKPKFKKSKFKKTKVPKLKLEAKLKDLDELVVRRFRREGFVYIPDLYSIIFGVKASAKEKKAFLRKGAVFSGLEVRKLV